MLSAAPAIARAVAATYVRLRGLARLHFEVLAHAVFQQLARVGFVAVFEPPVQGLGDAAKHLHHCGVEMTAGVLIQNRHGRVEAHWLLVRAL